MRYTATLLVIGAASAAAGCAPAPTEWRIVEGECIEAYGGNVCTWARLDGDGGLLDYGVRVPMATIENAPHDMAMVWPPVPHFTLRMPGEVTTAAGIDHFTMYWEAHGHPPGPYMTPHFDFHFNNVASAAREAVDCSDTSKPAALPAGYTLLDIEIPQLGNLVGLCVPQMGMHAMPEADLTDPAWTGTMVIGYYGGSPVFFEPMVAKALLMKRASFELPMPVVTGLPSAARYPSRFRAEYDAGLTAYRLVFTAN
jgi:hypothetical protein